MSDTELFYNQSEDSKVSGVQLLKLDKNGVKLCQQGGKILKALPSEQNFNLCFIFGNARSGKSFMMNCLSGVRGLFEVVNSSTPCTRGVHISTHIVDHTQLLTHVQKYKELDKSVISNLQKQQGGKGSKAKGPPLVGFIDVEGAGSEDGHHDTMLALPMLMTGKVVLFNHKGAPTVAHMLSQLGVLARAAEYIDLEDENGSSNTEEKSTKFGHLHVLMRDFSFESSSDDVYKLLMDKEKVPKKIRNLAKGQMDPATSAKERNDIRQMLQDNFASINVWLFKQPALADALMEHNELPADQIDSEFIGTVQELLAKITEQMTVPTKFNGTNLSGPRMSILISQVCSMLNAGGAVNVPSVFRAMEKEAIVREYELRIDELHQEMKSIESKLPLDTNELDKRLSTVKNNLLHGFDTQLIDCGLVEERDNHRKELKKAIDNREVELKKANKERTTDKVRTFLETESAKLKEELKKFYAEGPYEDPNVLKDKFAELKTMFRENTKKEFEGTPGVLELPQNQVIVCEFDDNNEAYLTLISTQNETETKSKQIDTLQNDMKEQRKLLDEQTKGLQDYYDQEKKRTTALDDEMAKLKQEQKEEEKRCELAEQEYLRQQAEIEKLQNGGCCTII